MLTIFQMWLIFESSGVPQQNPTIIINVNENTETFFHILLTHRQSPVLSIELPQCVDYYGTKPKYFPTIVIFNRQNNESRTFSISNYHNHYNHITRRHFWGFLCQQRHRELIWLIHETVFGFDSNIKAQQLILSLIWFFGLDMQTNSIICIHFVKFPTIRSIFLPKYVGIVPRRQLHHCGGQTADWRVLLQRINSNERAIGYRHLPVAP